MFQEQKQTGEMDRINSVIDGNTLVLKGSMGGEIEPVDVSRRTGTISVPGMISLPVVAPSSLPVKVVAPALHEHMEAKTKAGVKAEARRSWWKEWKETVADFFETLVDSGKTVHQSD